MLDVKNRTEYEKVAQQVYRECIPSYMTGIHHASYRYRHRQPRRAGAGSAMGDQRITGALTENQLYAALHFALGWIGALQWEGLIQPATYDALAAEFEALHDAQLALLRQ